MPTQRNYIQKHLYYQVILPQIILRKQLQEIREANRRMRELARFYQTLPKLLLAPCPFVPTKVEIDSESIRGMVAAVRKLGTGKSD